jgi:multicomponent Na+:H+ antiporter subunit E
MFIIYFLLWIVFNERLTVEVALLGVVVSALVYWFTVKFMDYSPKKEWRALRKAGRGLRYAANLVVEIIKANFGVMRFIVSPKYEVEPQLIYLKTKLEKDVSRTVLANSITLTPGTITVSAEENLMCVHCLDRTLSEGLEDSDFEKKLLEMEAMDK